jgi:type IV secretory pathway TraG/TraD family ATPase VirD4
VAFSREERERHIYIVGKSGSGKSTVLFNLAMSDIAAGEGVAVIDPHGDLAEAIIDAIPPERTHQVCYLNVADTEYPVGFNPLARVPEALLESPRPTLLDLSRIYTDRSFRNRLVSRITDPAVARFWREEFPSYDQRFQAEAAAPILNKVGQITASPILRAILGQHSPKFDLAHAMDHGGILVANLAEPPIEAGGILIANLAKGKVGEQASNLLGSLLLSHLQLVAMARSDQAEADRRPFFVHVDEFQSFSTEAFASLLSEARKFATHFCLANQYTEQLSDGIRAAVLGNAGTPLRPKNPW